MSQFVRTCGETMKYSEHVSVVLTPAAQVRDWRQRWIEIQEHLKRLRAPHSEEMSGKSIQSANHALHSFFVQAYHLKDSLIHDSKATGVSGSTIENAIGQDPHLALLADLANLEKHQELKVDKKHQPRSGHVPVYGVVSGKSNGNTGWQLSVEIQHNGKTLDGLTFADEAVSQWEKQLRNWKLI
jgi:hypothetical protein